MANSLKVVDMVLKEALKVAHEKALFIGSIDRQHDASFAYNASNGPRGQTLRIRNPNQFKRRQGSRVMDVQDTTETTQTITLATQDGFDMRFNSAELMQSVNSEGAWDALAKQYIIPAVSACISGIEADCIAAATKATAQVAGTAGTALTDLEVIGAARAKLNQQLAPSDGNRNIMGDSVVMGRLVNGLRSLNNPGGTISEQYREGVLTRNGGADWMENDRMWTMPNSSDVACTINAGTLTSGITALTVNNVASGGAAVAGMVFTVAGVFDCHPETKTAYSHLKQFVAGVGSTTTNLVFSPAIIFSTTDPRQNCSGAPVTTADITFVGSASTNYVQHLMYHRDAYQFVTADLPIMDDAHKCVRMSKDGLSMRIWMFSDGRNDELLIRGDILYGFAQLRPEWGCRLIGAAN